MVQNRNGESERHNASEYLRGTKDAYDFNPVSGLYETKTKSGDTYRRGQFVISAIGLVVSILTLFLLLMTVIYAGRQWCTMDSTLTEVRKQSKSTETAAQAAKQSADIATQTLYVTNRAFISEGSVHFDFQNSWLSIPLVNRGHLLSGHGEVIAFETLLNVADPAHPKEDRVDKYWTKLELPTVPIGDTYSFNLRISGMNEKLIASGNQAVMAMGWITYNDGFPDTKPVVWQFCATTDFDPVTRQNNLIQCDPAVYIPQAEKTDQYPSKKFYRK
jgi:hypothetical protein